MKKIKYNRLLGVFLLSLIIKLSLSQGENNNWYFGNGAGISFNTTPSSMIYNGANMASLEGVASISCPNGNLLFYTDGYTVFNKNHVMMGNGSGLNGCLSSAQNVIIVPQPQTPNIFYVFTVPAGCSPNNGFQYSIVDLSLNGGLGGVTSKNVLINGMTTQGEKITSTLHGNGIDVWISIENSATSNIEMYLLTSSGLNTTPVTSSIIIPGVVGPSVYLNPISSLSTLKFSKDGTKFCNFIQKAVRTGPSTTDYYNYLEIFNFNKNTGVLTLSDTVLIPYATWATFPNQYKASGLEFSGDGTKVYFTYNNIGYSPDVGRLYQVDITATNIASSISTIANGPGDFLYIQRGPDDKIYVKQHSTNYIVGIIDSPNISGLGCAYTYSHFDYTSTGKNSSSGFPQLIAGKITSPYLTDFTYTDTCFNENTLFTLSSNFPSDIDSVSWNFDDTTTGISNFSNLQNPGHIFSSGGFFNVELIVYYPCFTDTIVKNVQILRDSAVTATSSTVNMCSGDTRTLTGTPAGGTWSVVSGPGTITGSILTATGSGNIQIKYLVVGQCTTDSAMQTISVTNTIVVSAAASASSLCENLTKILTGSPTGGIWVVLSGPGTIIGDTLFPTGSGTVQIEYSVSSLCGNGADTIDIVINPTPNANAGIDENICVGDTVTLTATGGGTYQWTPGPAGASNQVYPPVTTGYRVDVTSDSGCIASDSVTVFVQSTGTATAQDDQGSSATGVQETIDVYTNDVGGINTIQILSGPSHGTATVSNGNVLYTSTAGYIGNDTVIYEICDGNCGVICDTAIVVIVVENDLTIPIGVSVNGDGKNDVFNILGLGRYPNNSIQIFNRWGSLIFQAEPYLNDWEGQNTEGSLFGDEVVEGTYFYILKLGEGLPSYNGYIELKK